MSSYQGTSGNDVWAGKKTEADKAWGYAGDDRLTGGDKGDFLYGGTSADRLDGGGGNDHLYGDSETKNSAEADTLIGGAGDDWLSLGAGGSADGGTGTDRLTLDLSGSPDRILADLSGLAGGDSMAIGGGTIRGIEIIDDLIGSRFNDNISAGSFGATGKSLTIEGGGGNDVLHGGGGDDRLYGDVGDDILHGGDGNDQLRGNSGTDTLFGDAGDDYVELSAGAGHGGAGNDTVEGVGSLYGDAGDDMIHGSGSLSGGTGSDVLQSYTVTDQPGTRLDGGSGNDVIHARVDDIVDGGSGTDVLSLESFGSDPVTLNFATGLFSTGGSATHVERLEQIQLGEGNDTVVLGNQVFQSTFPTDNGVFGNGGDDHLTGGAMADVLRGGEGDDILKGGDGDDQLYGGDGKDSLDGGAGNDTLQGGEKFYGDGKPDALAGGSGDDVLISGTGDDKLDGGSGSDIVSYRDATAGVHVTLGLSGAQNTIGAGRDTLIGVDGLEGSQYADQLTGDSKANLFIASDGNDHIDGKGGVDTLSFADDAYYGADLDLSAQSKNFVSIENLLGGTFDDHLSGSSSANTIDGGGGNDVLGGAGGDDVLLGGAGDDTIEGGSGDDQMLGGDGADNLIDGKGSDTIDGGAGDDTITIGTASDVDGETLKGGAGTDTLSVQAAHGGSIDLATALSARDIEKIDASGWSLTLTASELNSLDSVNAAAVALGSGGEVDLSGKRIDIDNLTLNKAGNTINLGDADYVALHPVIHGGTGKDIVTAGKNAISADGGGGNDTLTGGSHNDVLSGGSGDDLIAGGAGDDVLTGAAGKDKIDGQDGSDTIVIVSSSDASGDVLRGGAGTDTLKLGSAHPGLLTLDSLISALDIEKLDAAGWAVGLTGSELDHLTSITAKEVHLHTGGSISFSGVTIDVGRLQLGDSATTVDFSHAHVENGFRIAGGAGVDHITGSAQNDIISGGGGADVMSSGGGYDTFYVDSTHDVITAGSKGQVISSVNYTLTGSLESLTLTGNAHIGTGNGAGNTITGGNGDDILSGGANNDSLHGGAGNDILHSGSGTDLLDGGSGDDILYVEGTPGFINGGSGHDIVYLDANGANISGVEEIHLIGSADDLDSSGAATIYANNNRATTIFSGLGVDHIIGGNANDTVFASDGNDIIDGGGGDDHLNGGNGNDIMTGGAGADSFRFDHFSTTEVDEIKDYSSAQGDKLDFSLLASLALSYGVSEIDYIGTGAFTGHAGEAHIDLSHAGYGLFQFDLDGDRVSDLTIKLDGVTASSTILYQL